MPLSLILVDELIAARRNLHGGSVGAPRRLVDGNHEGRALNRACVIMLSSAMQAYVGEVFLKCSEKAFGRTLEGDEREQYIKTWSRWGNPSDANIRGLFLRLGVNDVFDGLSWQGQSTTTLKKTLNKMNQVRNRIAHGEDITVDGKPFALTLYQVQRWRKVSGTFGERFEGHALSKLK
ncbi:hypothetical protein [Rhodobacter sp. TJ_12]|uniref:hypothetical protein n=1 Tax=Rhodobacter sp. TJ_12 TaxID=2029399 RepID=UPI001CBB3673|nr:hypothetical protein [Rhodobacter sp. TJ_12]